MHKTYFLDIDGVLIQHNGSLSKQLSQIDSTLIMPETLKMLDQIERNGDKIILTTGRKESMRAVTEKMLTDLGIFYDVLIMGCNRGPRVIVNDLKSNSNIKTAFAFTPERNNLDSNIIEKIITPTEERPWGTFSTLAYSKNYHIKEIMVKPKCSSSLQSHEHRDEFWLVVKGIGECIIENQCLNLQPGDVCQIEKNQKHRVRNTGAEDLIFIEVQTGDLFSESDIVRYEDQFGRT